MKSSFKKGKTLTQEEIVDQVQRLLEESGSKALEMARQAVLEEKIECKEVREALKYFMTEYWHDLARPALLSLTCKAVGGDPNITTPIAIPMILINGAIDIHDDIIDQSKMKGSRPTVLGKFGKDIALLVGDALLFKGLTMLIEAIKKEYPTEKGLVIVNVLKEMFFELGDAEALELQFRGRINVTPDEYLLVVRKKAADVEAHTRISGVLGNGTKNEIEALARYGRLLGMLIILQDDLRDIFDFEEFSHRISKESLPLPVFYALQKPSFKSKIIPTLQKKMITKEDLQRLFDAVKRADGLDHVQEVIQKLMHDAEGCLEIVGRDKTLELLRFITFFAPTNGD